MHHFLSLHKKGLLRSAALVLLVGTAVAAFLFRPLTIQDGSRQVTITAPVLTVGQVLYRAGITVAPDDRVTPPLDQLAPLIGEIQIERAAHAYLWNAGSLTHIAVFGSLSESDLLAAGISLHPGDRLTTDGHEFSLQTPVSPGQVITLQIERAVSLYLIENGQAKTLLSYGGSLASALWRSGVKIAPGDRVSVELNESVSHSPDSITVLHARKITVLAQGQEISGRSAAANVGQALAENKTALQALDYSIPAEDQPLPQDGRIRVVRVSEELVFDQQLLPFESTYQPDPDLPLDQRRVLESGLYGVQVSRYRVRYEDGQEISRVLDSDWTASQPQTQVVGYGTQAVVQTLDTPDGTIEYWRAVNVYATAYSPCNVGRPNYCSDRTASGMKLTRGIIAVSTSWYGYMVGQRVYISGYGFAIIADMGYGIPGTPWIDLGYDDDNYPGGARNVTMYFLTPVPENVPWLLP